MFRFCKFWTSIKPVPFLAHNLEIKPCLSCSAFRLQTFSQRTHSCGELRKINVGENVILQGWLHNTRYGYFLILRDSFGITQVTLPSDELKDMINNLPRESVLEVNGVVAERPEGQANKNMDTGKIEVLANSIKVLNKCKADLPFFINEHHNVKESLRLKYRFYDLRNWEMQHNLRTRSQMVMKIREFLCNDHNFVEVETPTLFRKTPGGAREFLVPTHEEGKFYSLPQSPQQFKQLLMAGGIDRYVQIARCYRDEGSKPDRQPEFTQVDMEMSFVTQEHVKNLVEQMIQYAWPQHLNPISAPFPVMTYDEAMMTYGVDKPDLRLEKIVDISHMFSNADFIPVNSFLKEIGGSVKALCLRNLSADISNKELDSVISSVKNMMDLDSNWLIATKLKGDSRNPSSSLEKKLDPSIWRNLCTSLNLKNGDILLLAAGLKYSASEAIAKVREVMTKHLIDKGINVPMLKNNTFNFLWVVDFPLFLAADKEVSTVSNDLKLESAHHPFTAPKEGEEYLVYENPELVSGQHYDLVLNGNEIGGGSIRIHNSKLQRYILNHVLQEDTSELEHLLTALDLGCPPHGGIALGLDRLMAVINNTHSIRDVIAFPKSGDGRDLMSSAPAEIGDEDREYYHLPQLKIKTKKENVN